jgi:hypothetical protein
MIPMTEEQRKKKELEDFLTLKFGTPSSSGFDVATSTMTPVNEPLPQPAFDSYQLAMANPPPEPMPEPMAAEPTPEPVQTPMSQVMSKGTVGPNQGASTDPLDAIIARKQRPDPLAPYDKRIMAAQESSPNMGQVIGAGFAGLGQAMTLGRENYLDKTLGGIEMGRQRDIKSAELAKSQFEEGDERDPNSPISKEFQDTAAAMTGRKPEDLAGLSAYDIKKVLPTLSQRYTIKERSDERKSEDAYRRDMIAATKGVKTQETEKKLADEKLALEVPGFINTGKVKLSEAAAEKLREGRSALDQFLASMESYKAKINKYGTQEITNPRINQEMKADAKALQLEVKNLAQLGVLSASDIPYIAEQIPDPGLFKTQSGMLGSLNATEQRFKNKVIYNMKARGYEPDDEMKKVLSSAPTSESNDAQVQTDEDAEALKWAEANPTDPRAKQILALHGR